MKNSNRWFRKRLRLANYDYSTPGAYFLTICVNNHQNRLASISHEKVQLKLAGEIVKRVWSELPIHYSHIGLDEFVVMPNHFHGILWLTDRELSTENVVAGLKPRLTCSQVA